MPPADAPAAPARGRRIDARAFAAIDGGTLYPLADVADLFRRTPETVAGWCRAGKLSAVADPFDPRRYLIPGSIILAAAAPLLVASVAPGPDESERQRQGRAAGARAEMRRLARAPRS